MAYRIPDEKTVIESIGNVLKKHTHIDTQRELTDLVLKDLRKKDPEYRIGGERIRRLGIDNNLMKINIEYHTADNRPLPDVCPVCKNAMNPIHNMTLDGKVVEIKRKCTVCPFSVGTQALVPGKYGFTIVMFDNVSENEKRIRHLRKAKVKLTSALEMIHEALEMSEFESLFEYSAELVDSTISSDENPGSIKNLIKALKDADKEDPLWTRPTVSIKNVSRKDI